MEVITLLIFVGICLLPFIKKVPPNTVIIIDRNSHFHKKKYRGYYWFNPSTDMITTRISTTPITELYKNTFETHDSSFFTLTYSFTYNTDNVETVLSSLEDSRRSIYDIVNCAVETAVASYGQMEMVNNLREVESTTFHQLESMLEPFYIDVTKFRIISRASVASNIGPQIKFQKHVCSGDNPIR